MTPDIQQKIITALKLEGKSSEEQEKVIMALGGVILQAILVKVTESLSDEQVIRFDAVLSSSDSVAIEKFMQEEVKDLDKLVAEASKEIIETYNTL